MPPRIALRGGDLDTLLGDRETLRGDLLGDREPLRGDTGDLEAALRGDLDTSRPDRLAGLCLDDLQHTAIWGDLPGLNPEGVLVTWIPHAGACFAVGDSSMTAGHREIPRRAQMVPMHGELAPGYL